MGLTRRLVTVCTLLIVGLGCWSGLASAQGGEAIAGTFLNREDGNKPVAGVKVDVVDSSGKKVGTAVSDDSGKYSLDLPGPGTYTAKLQVGSLPKGVRLTDTKKTQLTVEVSEGRRRAIIFPFGKGIAGPAGALDRLPGTLLDGVRLGLIIAMTAIGLSLIYGTTQFTNFAHGEMVTFGALVTWFLNHDGGLPVLWSALIAVALSAVAGLVLDAGLWGPLRKRKTSPFSLMVVSFGLSITLIAVYQLFFGTRNRPFTEYAIQKPLFSLGSQNVPPRAIVTIVLSVVVLGAVGLFLQRARFGKAMRAVADNGPLAASSGINTARVVRLVWMMGSALAGLGGVLYSLDQGVNFLEGQSLLLLMFAGITLGGLGTSFGAAAGCFILGVAIQLSTLVNFSETFRVPPSLKNVGALVVLIVVLMVRPQGVFGRRERVG